MATVLINSSAQKRRRWPLISILLVLVAAPAVAQSVPTANAPASPPRDRPIKEDEILKINVFEVKESADTSYGALNSNAITRFNTPLKELPVTADIFTETFMADVGATSVEEVVMKYSAGGGFSTSDPGSDAASVQEGDRQATSSVTVRGLMSPTLRRDGFIQLGSLTNPGSTGSGFSTNFDIERVEVVNGPQSLIYGSGGGGGVINTVSKQARFNKSEFGSVRLKVNQYGHKSATFDAGVGNSRFAARFAVIDEEVGNRRVNIGGPLVGYYIQFAANLAGNTIVRLTASQTEFDRLYNANLTFTALNTANDARNGQNLKYLLATNQIEASATGASGGGPLTPLTWDNVDSFAGEYRTERSKNEYITLTTETKWSSWLSTDFSVGYNNFEDRLKSGGGGAFVAPNVAANTTRELASNASSATNWKPTRTTAVRLAAVANHAMWGSQARSQTMFGVDYNRSRQTSVVSSLYRADADWNIIGAGSTRSVLPAQYYSIANGPVKRAFWDPFDERVTINGVNYVKAIDNTVDQARISPENPLGVTLGGAVYQFTTKVEKGVYLVNFSKWMDNKLSTLVGARYNDSVLSRDWASVAGSLRSAAKNVDFNVGANYALRDWLSPYFGLSTSFNPPLEQGIGPDGVQVKTSMAKGAETGVKVQSNDGKLSGSIALFYLDSKDENQRIPGAYITEINPNGINGQYGAASTWANVSRKSQGLQASFTHNPTRNWRMRVAGAVTDGTIGTTKEYAQFYNDEFHANAAGQVTFRDGAQVYVPAVASATTPVVSSTTPGAVPLTIAMLNSPTSVYYANPAAISGAINANSAAARALEFVDPAHGPIATGRTGLPISAQQINPGFTPPGRITTAAAGEATTGYAKYSMNFTNMYTFPSGWIKGLRLGGTLSLGWQKRGFYYYPDGVASNVRELFYLPNIRRFDTSVGYSHRFQRYTLSAQVNINNTFNDYEVLILPNAITGWGGIKNATFSQEPRTYVFSTTVSF